MKVYQVGRLAAGNVLVHAFDIKRREDGGITISNVTKLSGTERHELMTHFGSPRQTMTGDAEGGSSWSEVISVQPGTQEHFDAAVYMLPSPFGLMPGQDD